MKKRIAIIVSSALVVFGLTFGLVTAFGVEDNGPGCTKTSADGTSSLHVSQRALDELQAHGWKATDETGKLVCP